MPDEVRIILSVLLLQHDDSMGYTRQHSARLMRLSDTSTRQVVNMIQQLTSERYIQLRHMHASVVG